MTTSPPTRNWLSLAKASSISWSELTLRIWISRPNASAAACTCFRNASLNVSSVGLTSSAMTAALGINSLQQLQPFRCHQLVRLHDAGDVAARPAKAGDKAEFGLDRRPFRKQSEWSWLPPLLRQALPGCWWRQSRSPPGEPDRPPAPAGDRCGPRPNRYSMATLRPST